MPKQAQLNFIGTVETASESEARIRIFPEYCKGLEKITQFSHLIILYWIHLRDNEKDRRTLQVYPTKHAVNVKV